MTAWATASKINMSNLTRVQNMGIWLITGGMKSTQTQAMEKLIKIQLLERQVEKVLVKRQNVPEAAYPPLTYQNARAPSGNRLKRLSQNHLSQNLQNEYKNSLPQDPRHIEPLYTTNQ
jgi:hypothetical protein